MMVFQLKFLDKQFLNFFSFLIYFYLFICFLFSFKESPKQLNVFLNFIFLLFIGINDLFDSHHFIELVYKEEQNLQII